MIGNDEIKIEIENILNEFASDTDKNRILELISTKKTPEDVQNHKDGITDDQIKLKLLYEKDWRKRASLSAMLISRSLE